MSTLTIHGGAFGCAACGVQLGRLKDFDAHQVIDYSQRRAVTCKHPTELDAALTQDARGVWKTREGMARRARLADGLLASP